ncbi:hypothetical protein [Microbulbifer sp. SAOS-129_SWC]|uniref:hypothetical protein n=1 Tax=Microbulbifer sp. SAOS-129_SWC TaxID=3145235 RepID=UPI003217DD3D
MSKECSDALSGVENSLRLIINKVGEDSYGNNYIDQLGVDPKKIKKWEKSREKEGSKRSAGIKEKRLLYYSDFYDLERIIIDNWSLFNPVFSDKCQTQVYLDRLRTLRNPDAHRRSLTNVEKSLVIGMAGEIRTKVARFMAEKDTPNEYFPRFEALYDSLGNHFGQNDRPTLRVGMSIEFIAEAWDPYGEDLDFQWSVSPGLQETLQDWSSSNRFTWNIREENVSNPAHVNVNMKSRRAHHAERNRDAGWSMQYTVLPKNI